MTEHAHEHYLHIPIADGLMPSVAAQHLTLMYSDENGRVIGGRAWERRKQHILANPAMIGARDSEALLSMAKRNFITHPDSGARERATVAISCVEMSALLDLCTARIPEGACTRRNLAAALDRMASDTTSQTQHSVKEMIQEYRLRIILDALLDAKAGGLLPQDISRWSAEKGLFLTNWTVEVGYGSLGVARLRRDQVAARFTPDGQFLLDAAANEANVAVLRRVMSSWDIDERYTLLLNIAKVSHVPTNDALTINNRQTCVAW